MSFKPVALMGAVLCGGLTAGIGLASPALLDTWGLTSVLASEVIARRAAMLFLGMGITFWLLRNEPPSLARRAFSVGFAVSFFALVAVGLGELAAGHVGLGILLPMSAEIAFGAALIVTRNQ
jgi:hypothetical protein